MSRFSFCFLFFVSPLLVEGKTPAKKSHHSHTSLFYQNSSKKAYLLHKARQKEFEGKKDRALRQRQRQSKGIQKEKAIQNKIEELEMKSHFQADKISPLGKKLSRKEEAFWSHHNQIRLIETARKRAFLRYKKQFNKDKKKKQTVLQKRLKRTQLLRKKLKSLYQTVEVSPFETL